MRAFLARQMLSPLCDFQEQSMRHRKEIGFERRFIMKTNRIRLLAMAAVGLAAVCASARPVSAQNAWQGSFTLPNEVHWQGAILPAGDYTFSMETAVSPNKMVVRRKDAAAIILTISTSTGSKNQPSQLTIERHGDAYFVSEMYSADLGVQFRYSIPAPPKDQLLAQNRVSTEHVLIAELRK
jgi:hypothetical protein